MCNSAWDHNKTINHCQLFLKSGLHSKGRNEWRYWRNSNRCCLGRVRGINRGEQLGKTYKHGWRNVAVCGELSWRRHFDRSCGRLYVFKRGTQRRTKTRQRNSYTFQKAHGLCRGLAMVCGGRWQCNWIIKINKCFNDLEE